MRDGGEQNSPGHGRQSLRSTAEHRLSLLPTQSVFCACRAAVCVSRQCKPPQSARRKPSRSQRR